LGRVTSIYAPAYASVTGTVPNLSYEPARSTRTFTYGEDGRIASIQHPKPGGGTYYEVFDHDLENRKSVAALSTDATYSATADTSYRTEAVSYAKASNYWWEITETGPRPGKTPADDGPTTPIWVTKREVALGPFPMPSSTAATVLIAWVKTTTAAGTVIERKTFRQPSAKKIQTDTYQNGALVYSQAWVNGTPAWITTPDFTKYFPVTELREPKAEPSLVSSYWPTLEIEPDTGLVRKRFLPGSSTVTEEYGLRRMDRRHMAHRTDSLGHRMEVRRWLRWSRRENPARRQFQQHHWRQQRKDHLYLPCRRRTGHAYLAAQHHDHLRL
jgi:hypothetical protein